MNRKGGKTDEVAKQRTNFKVVGETNVCRAVPRPLVPELDNWGKKHGKLFVAALSSSSAVLREAAAALARCASPAHQQQNGWFSDELRGTQRRSWSSGLVP